MTLKILGVCVIFIIILQYLNTRSTLVFFLPQPLQRIENEVELLGEHLPVGGFTYPSSAHPPTLPPSAPLQFLAHDPLHQEVSFGVVSFHSVLFALVTCFELFQCN